MFLKHKFSNIDIYTIFVQKDNEQEQNSNYRFIVIINFNYKIHVKKFTEIIIEHE